MKKFLAILTTLCLLCGATALATEYNPSSGSNPQTELKATVSAGYTIVIPATVEIPFNQLSTNLPISVTALHLPTNGNALKVEVANMDALKNETGKLLSYTINGVDAKATLYFTALTTQNFVIGITQDNWNKAHAGNYSQTIRFNVSFTNID